jgi:hypothetical protein
MKNLDAHTRDRLVAIFAVLLLGVCTADAQNSSKKAPTPKLLTPAPTKSNSQKAAPNTPKQPVRKLTEPKPVVTPKEKPKPVIQKETPNSLYTRKSTPDDREIRTRRDGRVAEVHDPKRGIDIHHSLDHRTRVVSDRRDGVRVVSERGGRSYVQHPFHYGDREYAHRSYYYNGRAYDRYYAHYEYRGVYVEYYTPAIYYRPAFYGWAYNPWTAPVPYAWGFAANPWYGYYGYYFSPYPVYPSASVWLTDYLISTTLAAAYQADVNLVAEARASVADAAPLTADVKDLISAEVQRQIALENAEAQNPQATDPSSSSVQRLLTDNIQHIFVADSDLDLVDSSGAECAVSEGDVLRLSAPPPSDAPEASLVVLSSKGGVECKRGASVSVKIADLQEMQNHLRETIDQGMGEMRANKELPKIPTGSGEPIQAAFVSAAPSPDLNAAAQINDQLQASAQAEKDVNSQVAQPLAPPAAPANIVVGQSVDEVIAALGQPTRSADLGARKIYFYNDMKITFEGNRVSDVK